MAEPPGRDERSDDAARDDAADTQMFQRFVDSDEPEPSSGSNTFRLITLAIGLLVLAGLIWLMFEP